MRRVPIGVLAAAVVTACSAAPGTTSTGGPSLSEAPATPSASAAVSADVSVAPSVMWVEVELPPSEELGSRLLAAIDLPGPVCDLTASEEHVWVTLGDAGVVVEIDPATNGVTRELVRFETGACAIAWAGDALWVATYQDLIQQIQRVDPATGEVTGTIDFTLSSSIFAMEGSDDGLWVLNRQREEVYRVDTATAEIVETFAVGYGASDMDVTEEAVWVTSDVSGGVDRIDRATGDVANIPVEAPRGVAVDDRGVWAYVPVHEQLSLFDSDTLAEVAAWRFEFETGSPDVAGGVVWLPSPDGGLLAFESATGEPAAVFVTPPGLDHAKVALGDLWLFGPVDGVLRVDPRAVDLPTT